MVKYHLKRILLEYLMAMQLEFAVELLKVVSYLLKGILLQDSKIIMLFGLTVEPLWLVV